VHAGTNGHSPESVIDAFETLPGVERVEPLPSEDNEEPDDPHWRVRLYVSGEASQLVAPTATLLADRGLSLSGVELGEPTLEDVFIHLTGRTLR